MIIDEFCPECLVRKQYEIDVNADIERVYNIAHTFNMSTSLITKWLLRLRGIDRNFSTIDGLKEFGFVILGDKKEEEIAFGVVGKFWTFPVHIQQLDPHNFKQFNKEGFAKAVGNIAFISQSKNITNVSTETRVHCFDKRSALLFRLYWAIISPFSGLIRKDWLRTIKTESER
jgi:hypothetical protein